MEVTTTDHLKTKYVGINDTSDDPRNKYTVRQKVKHHLTCFNNIFSNNELISNRFAVFVTSTHILTYL